MKHITFIALFALLLGTTFSLNAQQKVGHVNSLTIFEKLPERIKADEELQAKASSVRGELEKMAKAFETKVTTYQQNAPKQKPEVNKATEESLKAEQDKLQKFQADATKDLEAAQKEKYAPISKKIEGAINEVAKAKTLAYVFDSSQNGLIVYIDPATSVDVTTEVMTKLGIK